MLISALHQVIEMELLDHGLAVGADLIGHVVEVHGIKGIKVILEAGVLMVFLGRFIRFGFLRFLRSEGWHHG